MRVVYWAKMNLARSEITRALGAVPGAELVIVESLEDLLVAIEGAAALVLPDASIEQATSVVAAVAEPAATVRWMHFLTAGREGFDAVGLPPHIKVTHPARCVAPTVAEHAMTLLLAMVRRVPAMLEKQQARDWQRIEVSKQAITLEGGTMAIVGFGNIGREIARRARAFGVRTVGLSRCAPQDEFLDEGRALSEPDAVLPTADFVMLSIALTVETTHLFGRDRFGICKPGSLLVNVARGGVVDQVALAEALVAGQIAGAAIDATDPEPLPKGDPLWDAPNLIVSPHFAGGGSAVSRQRLADLAADNLKRFIAGEQLKNLVA